MQHPIREVFRGSHMYLVGVKWLKSHPKWLFILLLTSLLSLVCMLGTLALFWEYQAEILRVILFEPGESWLWVFLYYICKVLLYLAALGLALLSGLLTASVLAAPVYEYLSCAVERERRGVVQEISFWYALKQIPEELKKVLLILSMSLVMFFIPGLNVLAILVTVWLIAWDYYDYPMARRGWRLKQRLGYGIRDGWALLGLGLWLLIPIAHFILLPMALVGGTLLSLERIDMIERRRHGSGKF